MRTLALAFFWACLYAPVAIAAGSWLGRHLSRAAKVHVDAHVEAALGPDPRVLAGLELAKGNPDFAAWEAELTNRSQWPYDQEVQGS